MHTGKTFSAISSRRRQAVKELISVYCHVSQFLTKLDCEQSLSVPQNRLSGRKKYKIRAVKQKLAIIGKYNSKTSRLITISFTHSRFTVSDFEYIVCLLGRAAPQCYKVLV